MTRHIPVMDGWFVDGPEPHLIGHECTACGTVAFPFPPPACPNPSCAGTEFGSRPLSRTGTVWSYTDARYQPPPPYVAGDDFTPFALAAVELDGDGIIIVGQVAAGYTADQLSIGTAVTVVVEPLFVDLTADADDPPTRTVYRWRPVGIPPSQPAPAVPVLAPEVAR